MTESTISKKGQRQRASKACQRCSSRKSKCDAAEVGLPCSRCRRDGIDKCEFIASRRGTYDRATIRTARAVRGTDRGTSQRFASDTESAASGRPDLPLDVAYAPSSGDFIGETYPEDEQTASLMNAQASSLGFMFEEFLRNQGREAEDLIGRYGIVLLGDSSPLTFAFHELPIGRVKDLHEGTAAISQGPRQSAIQRKEHPSHLDEADLLYLHTKGAFELPDSKFCFGLFDAFLEHFYPFYPMIDKEKAMHQHTTQNVPWILLHAICMIGASYCSIDLIHKAGMVSRQQCRRRYYEKAKILYDTGYETNRVVLLQAIVLLTFWGPDMKSYWNPCSWVGVAVTIAESLGIHRSNETCTERSKERRLLKRLWYIITVRDVYCASLLGRPCYIRMAQENTPILSIEDFEVEAQPEDGSAHSGEYVHALYQIELLKLSMIMREIVDLRPHTMLQTARQDLYNRLEDWMNALPPVLSWSNSATVSDIFGESLKVMYYHHVMFLYMCKPGSIFQDLSGSKALGGSTASATEVAEGAAHMVSVTSLSLVTKSLVHSMPQEVFAAYFVAGIVFFRLLQQESRISAQLARAAFNNCRIVLDQVRDRWDSAYWGLRVIDFLLSAADMLTTTQQSSNDISGQSQIDTADDGMHFEPMSFTGTTLHDFDADAYFGNGLPVGIYDSMQSSEHPLALPVWPFFDQGSNFP